MVSRISNERKDRIKIAIILYKPLPEIKGGGDIAVSTIIEVLERIRRVGKIKIFAISSKDEEKKVSNKTIQKLIKGWRYQEKGAGRILDLLGLSFFGFRTSLLFISRNRKFLNELIAFNPHIIIAPSFQVSGLIEKYKKVNRKTKIVVYTDSPEVIRSVFNYLETIHLPRFIKYVVRKLLYERYINFSLKIFSNFVKNADIIIAPTSFDKEEIAKMIPQNNEKKVFVIPPVVWGGKKIEVKPIKNIAKIAFIGAADFWPNMEAVEIIKEKIAPKLKDIEFIIIGKGWKPKREENVNFIGEVKNLDPILKEASAFIAPVVSGSGMKTKILTYFQYGKPIIGTPLAFRGYNVKDEYNAIIEDNINNFYLRIIELNKNKNLIDRIQRNSIKAISNFKIGNITKMWYKVLFNCKI